MRRAVWGEAVGEEVIREAAITSVATVCLCTISPQRRRRALSGRCLDRTELSSLSRSVSCRSYKTDGYRDNKIFISPFYSSLCYYVSSILSIVTYVPSILSIVSYVSSILSIVSDVPSILYIVSYVPNIVTYFKAIMHFF